jgi:hypothetical protein
MNKTAQDQIANHFYNAGVQLALRGGGMEKNAMTGKQLLGALGGSTLGGYGGMIGGGMAGSGLGAMHSSELAALLGMLGSTAGAGVGTIGGGIKGYNMMADKGLLARILNK